MALEGNILSFSAQKSSIASLLFRIDQHFCETLVLIIGQRRRLFALRSRVRSVECQQSLKIVHPIESERRRMELER